MAVATVHKNMVEAHRLTMAAKEIALQNVRNEVQMYDRSLDGDEYTLCRARYRKMMEENQAWMEANPPPR